MSIECVLIKEEPKLELESNEEECNNFLPEFISIKTENHEIQPVLIETRIKLESASPDHESILQGGRPASQVKLEPTFTADDEESQLEELLVQRTETFNPLSINRDPSPKLRQDGLYSCPICHKSFTNKYHVTRHTRTHNRQTYQCSTCDRTFNKQELLNKHVTKTHDIKCKECDQTFLDKAELIQHKKCHVKTKTIKNIDAVFCPVCNKRFKKPGLMKPHMRKHTGEKPFVCVVCKKAFAHKHDMQRHELRHNKVKITTCYICNKKFPKESHLKYHMSTHVSEKYFECHVCCKKFSHKKNVVRHFRRKHPSDSYGGDLTDAAVATKVWREVLGKKESDCET